MSSDQLSDEAQELMGSLFGLMRAMIKANGRLRGRRVEIGELLRPAANELVQAGYLKHAVGDGKYLLTDKAVQCGGGQQ